VILDPDPDPARSYAERERLFRVPRSTWADYDAAIISAGGGVFARQAKNIPLSAPLRAMLGITADSAAGEDVVRAILRMEVDLLWNGGIGTYVKATDETHAEAGDSANDAVRVNGADLRVRVVGEGGNLGFTQRGRVEYALRGGRINTDAIDNSGGVDMSDHEVNLKIALAPAVAAGELSAEARDRLLTDLTADVTRRVLAHNQRQARILSLDQLRSQTQLDDYRDLVAHLEADGVLDRHLEHLPDREALRLRRATFLGLTRPELAVLLAHAKLALQQRMLASTLPDEPFFERYLTGYFPEAVTRQFALAVRSHRLRREIVAVERANELIDMMGTTFVSRIVRATETDAVNVARAWMVAMAVGAGADVWSDITGAAAPLTPVAEARAWTTLVAALERATVWVVETQSAETPVAELIAALGAPTTALLGALPDLLPASVRADFVAAAEALAGEGVPRPLAQRLAQLDRLAELLEAAHIAAHLDVTPTVAAEVYYRGAEVVDLDWVRTVLGEMPAADRWERRAVEGLQEGLGYVRRQLTRTLLAVRQTGEATDACLRAYVADNERQVTRVRRVIDDLRSGPRVTLAGLTVVMRELGRLVGGRP
jgi:glutamate dehydrogenase